jgi:hypothetical protein
VVDVERFVIKEGRAAPQAASLLGRGELAQAGGQELSFTPFALLPVLPQRRVIWRRCPFHQDMRQESEPGKLQEIGPGVFVSEHPSVPSLRIPLAPVPCFAPRPGFMRVSPCHVVPRAPEHPVVQLGKRLAGPRAPEVRGPPPNEGIEPLEDYAYL